MKLLGKIWPATDQLMRKCLICVAFVWRHLPLPAWPFNPPSAQLAAADQVDSL